MPTTRYLTQIIQDYVNRITGYDGMAPHEGISISRSTIFNRGNDANGVWSIKMQRDYIDSLMKGYPCGMICLVRDYGNAMGGYKFTITNFGWSKQISSIEGFSVGQIYNTI